MKLLLTMIICCIFSYTPTICCPHQPTATEDSDIALYKSLLSKKPLTSREIENFYQNTISLDQVLDEKSEISKTLKLKKISSITSAAKSGLPIAMAQYGKLLFFGTKYTEKDEKKGLTYICAASSKGNIDAALLFKYIKNTPVYSQYEIFQIASKDYELLSPLIKRNINIRANLNEMSGILTAESCALPNTNFTLYLLLCVKKQYNLSDITNEELRIFIKEKALGNSSNTSTNTSNFPSTNNLLNSDMSPISTSSLNFSNIEQESEFLTIAASSTTSPITSERSRHTSVNRSKLSSSKLSIRGNPDYFAQSIYSMLYILNTSKLASFRNSAYNMIRVAALNEEPFAMCVYGLWQIQEKFSTPKDLQSGISNIILSAEAMNPSAMLIFGEFMIHGLYGEPVNVEKGLSLIKQAADANEPFAKIIYKKIMG